MDLDLVLVLVGTRVGVLGGHLRLLLLLLVLVLVLVLVGIVNVPSFTDGEDHLLVD